MNIETGIYQNRVAYIHGGSGHRKVVVLAGSHGTRRSLEKTAKRWSKVYSSYLPPQSEYWILGYSNKDEKNYTFEDIAHSFSLFIRDTVGKCSLMAASFGGLSAIPLVVESPDLFDKMILIATGYKLNQNGFDVLEKCISLAKEGNNNEITRHASQYLFKRFYWRWLTAISLFLNKKNDQDSLTSTKNQLLMAANLLKYAYTDVDYIKNKENQFEHIQVPTLILSANGDNFFDYSACVSMSKKIPNAEIVTFKGEKHMFAFEKKKKTKEAIVNFLESE